MLKQFRQFRQRSSKNSKFFETFWNCLKSFSDSARDRSQPEAGAGRRGAHRALVTVSAYLSSFDFDVAARQIILSEARSRRYRHWTIHFSAFFDITRFCLAPNSTLVAFVISQFLLKFPNSVSTKFRFSFPKPFSFSWLFQLCSFLSILFSLVSSALFFSFFLWHRKTS